MKYGLILAALAASSYATTAPSHFTRRQTSRPLDPVNNSNTCGPQSKGPYFCPSGGDLRCCSQFGFCGSTDRHCGDGCQKEYGECGVTPPVAKDYHRELIGSVPYGVVINNCTKPKTIAFGMSNGPYKYTKDLLDILAQKKVKVTFFMESNNYGSLNTADNIALIQRMYKEGHQIASQGDSHKDFTTLTVAEKQNELSKFETAIYPIIGNKIPTYFRPPYMACDLECQKVAKSMGYHVITTNHDSQDYSNQQNIKKSQDYFTEKYKVGISYISVMQDDLQVTVTTLVPFAIDEARKFGYSVVPVGECLGDAPQNWYRPYVKDDEACPDGFTGADCKMPVKTSPASKECTGNFYGADCKICKRGWTGSKCDKCSPGYSGPKCHKAKKCDGNFTGENCDKCKEGWHGPKCDQCDTI